MPPTRRARCVGCWASGWPEWWACTSRRSGISWRPSTRYGGVLTTDSVVSLGRQGGAMSEEESAAFLARPWATDAVTLRRADDSGKVEGLAVGDLASWGPLLFDIARRAESTRS